MAPEQYMVCVSCLTYNHSSYIEDAMNGFCMQKTAFPFVCIIIDDASSDGEQEVINKYLSNHFDLSNKVITRIEEMNDYKLIFAQHLHNKNCYFAVFFLKENHYGKKKSKAPYVAEWRSKSKYCAVCEGDDFWIDELKLQTQVDFLEQHADYTMCFHAVEIKVEEGRKAEQYFGVIEDREYKADDVIKKWIVPTCSMIYRSEILKYRPNNPHFVFGDDVLYATCLSRGRIYGMSAKMGVYRLVPTGWMATHQGNQRLYSSISQRKGLMEEFPFYRCEINYKYMENVYFQLMYALLGKGKIGEQREVFDDYNETLPDASTMKFIKYCLKRQLVPIIQFIKKIIKKG